MRNLVYIICILGVVLSGCTGTSRQPQLVATDSLLQTSPDSSLHQLKRMDVPQSRADRMYYYLLLADACNKCYDTLPSDSILQEVADFYDRYGTPNEQVRAHYLLGCVYRDMGEAPMALDKYQKAIECADTTSSDCDFAQLSRAYGQMGLLFHKQSLYRNFLFSCQQAENFAMKGKDTLTALICYEQQSIAYRNLGLIDSAIYVVENVARSYSQYGFHAESAIALGSIANALIKIGDYKKAHEYIHKYETESGLFNREGEIEKGREVYYYPKGLYYLKNNQLDSAEYWYRKELSDGKDFNNQNGGALGLAMLYEQRHIPDSAAKYYHYAYAMNDSMYAQMATSEVERIQAMYDYSRHQKIARKEAEKALLERNKRLLTMLLLLLCVSVASYIIYNMYREKKESKKRYHNTLERLERTQSEVLQLRDMATDYSELKSFVEEKEQEIEHLKSLLNQDKHKILQSQAVKEEQIKRSEIFQSLLKKSKRGLPLCNEELRVCRIMVIDCLPELNNLLLSKQNYLNSKEFNMCVLFRLGFQSKEISNMLSVSPARISQMSVSVLSKLFKSNNGGAKELIAKLSEFY